MTQVVLMISVSDAHNDYLARATELGVRPKQERIYIGRRFKNDTERLEKLFDLYTKMAAAAGSVKSAPKSRRGGSA